jgi:hypothetical protein
MNLWSAKHISELGLAGTETGNRRNSMSWLVVAVDVDVTLKAVYRPDLAAGFQAAALAAGAKGDEADLRRRGTWLFCRGPLPQGFSPQISHLPWKLAAVW